MKNVTYLFGAGASAGAVPPSDSLRDNIKRLGDDIDVYPFPNSQLFDQLKHEFAADCKWLFEETHETTIDARAIQWKERPSEMKRLKLVLALTLSFWQRTKKVDPRYENFYSRLPLKDKQIPENVTILSWNYDSQFELSYANYFVINEPWSRYWSTKQNLKVLSKHYNIGADYKNYRILQLNGNACELKSGGVEVSLFAWDRELDSYEGLLTAYVKFRNLDSNSSISFATADEPSTGKRTIVDVAMDVVKTTDILFVVGYSFPDTNKKTDTKLLTAMLANLELVVIQDRQPALVEKAIRKILGSGYNVSNLEIEHEGYSKFYVE